MVSLMEEHNGRVLAAELVGTTVLMLGGPGTAILAGNEVGNLGIALGFGFSLLIMAYVIGPVSGCHINPAVTLGLFLAKKINAAHAVFAVIGQLVGAVLGATIIYGIASGRDDFHRGQFAANLWSGPYFGLGATIVSEVVLTALLVFVVLSTGARGFAPGMQGLVAGLTLTLIHLISIPVDNTSVNPARSLGAALFAESNTDALQQLWAFIVFPLIGAVVGVVVWLVVTDARLEETMLADIPGAIDVRDTIEIGTSEWTEPPSPSEEKLGKLDD
ncbi:MAG: permease, glycerol uptake facilitator [Ilumatobacteraceae bacterium]|nr:permease, glycerol uptake facilitator [Ilumatobacteraceae bacterium]